MRRARIVLGTEEHGAPVTRARWRAAMTHLLEFGRVPDYLVALPRAFRPGAAASILDFRREKPTADACRPHRHAERELRGLFIGASSVRWLEQTTVLATLRFPADQRGFLIVPAGSPSWTVRKNSYDEHSAGHRLL